MYLCVPPEFPLTARARLFPVRDDRIGVHEILPSQSKQTRCCLCLQLIRISARTDAHCEFTVRQDDSLVPNELAEIENRVSQMSLIEYRTKCQRS